MPSYVAPPWYSFLSIDLLLRVAKATLFSPILCWLYPLALRAQAFHWSMAPLRNGVIFALTVDFLWFLSLLNAYARRGKFSSRKIRVKETEDNDDVDEIDEVVVVTGGSSGLGQLIAEMFALKGISVAVLDVKKPNMEGNYALQYYECDVSNPTAIAAVATQITQDVYPLYWLMVVVGYTDDSS
jgi:short chain dehydrogenase